MKRLFSAILALALLMTAATAFAAGDNKHLSVLWSSTGNGNYADYTVERLKEEFGLDIDIEYNARAHEILQPQILAHNPPDVVMVNQASFDYFAAIEAGAFTPLSEYLDLPVEGSDMSVMDMANGSVIDAMRIDGEAYVLVSNMNVGGLCYNKAMFREHGWEVPTCWDEFIALCEEIKTTTDIAPFIYPGMYPYYLRQFFLPMVLSCGRGTDSLRDLNNMEEGIWVSDEVRAAAERLQYMRDHGYFAEGLLSMDHTTAQMEFINGNVAIVSCGSWLQNEMGDSWPEGFELGFMVDPTGATPDSEKFVQVSGMLMGFPSDAQNKEWIGEFLQSYFSPASVKTVVEDCQVVISPSAIANFPEVGETLTPFMQECFEAAGENTALNILFTTWYSEFFAEWQNQFTALISGEIDADEFCETMEALAQAVRDDDFITKYKVA